MVRRMLDKLFGKRAKTPRRASVYFCGARPGSLGIKDGASFSQGVWDGLHKKWDNYGI